jgi:hypothetical protein
MDVHRIAPTSPTPLRTYFRVGRLIHGYGQVRRSVRSLGFVSLTARNRSQRLLTAPTGQAA